MSDKAFSIDHGVVVEIAKPRLKQPPQYQVVLIDDDYTPMDFVVDVLTQVFCMSQEKATQVMLKVHTEGRGICGVYTRDVAETKVHQVIAMARQNEHPLLCVMEKA